ncbi:MAG: monovalent cation/H(+) antiporter subunit G [Eubacteriales bacterium]|nr:monovalent cation/H(+) antiporter subunit G [Eubacteriales bacterium]
MIKIGIILILLAASSFFFLVGTIGLIRMPDAFCRMHATTKSDTLGAGLALLALVIYRGFDVISIKLLIILLFVWITTPTAAHIMAKAAYNQKKTIEGVDQ